MQRKNDLLMPLKSTTRKTSGYILTSGKLFSSKKVPSRQSGGFAMIMAVVVMIVVSTIMIFTLKQTTQTAKRTADLYLHEQAELHTKSAIEYALFKIAEQGPCTTIAPIKIDSIYDVSFSLRYVYKNKDCGGTNNYITTILADEQNGSVLMDITVNVDENNTGSEPIRYFRRTIQKL